MPIAAISTSARVSEQSQVIPLLEEAQVPSTKGTRPRNCPDAVQMDKGYDSQPLRQKLRNKGVKPIIARKSRANGKKRLGRKAANLVDRWKVERAFAWMQRKFRRICVRWERRKKYWDGFIELAIAFMWLGKVLEAA